MRDFLDERKAEKLVKGENIIMDLKKQLGDA